MERIKAFISKILHRKSINSVVAVHSYYSKTTTTVGIRIYRIIEFAKFANKALDDIIDRISTLSGIGPSAGTTLTSSP